MRTLRSGDAFGYGIFNFPGSRAIMDEKGTCLEILSSCLSQPNLSASESGMEILQGGGLIMNKALRSGVLFTNSLYYIALFKLQFFFCVRWGVGRMLLLAASQFL